MKRLTVITTIHAIQNTHSITQCYRTAKEYGRKVEGDKGMKMKKEMKNKSEELRYKINHSPQNFNRFKSTGSKPYKLNFNKIKNTH
jgi:hypothetical protein